MKSRREAALAQPVEFELDPVDNARLAALCGPLEQNLRLVEVCTALEFIWCTVAGAGGQGSAAAERSAFYSRRVERLAPVAVAEYVTGESTIRVRLSTGARQLVRG